MAVAQFYRQFPQVDDEQVLVVLQASAQAIPAAPG
jgi:predicted phosphoribosyltransferase